MRFIDKQTLLYDLKHVRKVTKEERKGIEIAETLLSVEPEIDAIPVDWLRKKLIDLLYARELDYDNTLTLYYKIIAMWDKENE